MSMFIPCRKCSKLAGPQKGFYFVENQGSRFVKECECHKVYSDKQSLLRRLETAGIWTDLDYDPKKDYRGSRSLEDVDALKIYVKEFSEKFEDKMIYMFGEYGTQKTTLAMWVAREITKQGYKVKYSLMETLSVSLTPDFDSKDGRKEAYVRDALEADLLVVDEAFDRRTTTVYKSGYQIPFLTRFFKSRFEIEKRAILFVSNVRPSDISEEFMGLRSFVTRNVASSTLTFSDVYIHNANSIDPKGLFR